MVSNGFESLSFPRICRFYPRNDFSEERLICQGAPDQSSAWLSPNSNPELFYTKPRGGREKTRFLPAVNGGVSASEDR